jgi:hypothetical protein
MKLHVNLVWISIVCVCFAPSSYAQYTYAERFELAGVCEINGRYMVSLSDKLSGAGFWLHEGQSFGDLKFNSFDANTKTAVFFSGDHSFELKLRRADDVVVSVVSSLQHDRSDLQEIESKVGEYRKGLKILLADPDSGPRPTEAQAKLEKDMANMVTNYRDQLIAGQSEEAESSALQENAQASKVIGIKRRNRVNSRIWASDHIEKHGLPEE